MNEPTIKFENKFFVAIDKPSMWLSVPAREKSDPRPVATFFMAKKLNSQTLLPCHRLDYEASGLLLLAKNSDAHRAANKWFEEHSVRKTYTASSEGDPNQALAFSTPTIWNSLIVRGKKRSFEAPHGKPSVTLAHYLGVDSSTHQLKWHLQPETGRPHQLRFELSRHGFPIVGDILYGAKSPSETNGIALRAVELNFANCENHMAFGLPATVSV